MKKNQIALVESGEFTWDVNDDDDDDFPTNGNII
jgi:hypothetical protein